MPYPKWFATPSSKNGISEISQYSDVQVFVDAEDYYVDLRKEVELTKGGDLICWIGFDGCISPTPTSVNWDTPMPEILQSEESKAYPSRERKTTDIFWFDLLKAASERDVMIRVLLNLHPSPEPINRHKSGNFDLVAKLNTLKNCVAINDFRYLWMNGTNHQKLVLVYNKNGLSAYVGTCDIAPDRINEKWCEVQSKIKGDATIELYNIFSNKWKEHVQVFNRVSSKKPHLPPITNLKTRALVCANFLVQVATTYGNPKRRNPFHFIKVATPPSQNVNLPHRFEITTDNAHIPFAFPLIFLSPTSLIRLGNNFFTENEPEASILINEALKQNSTYAFAPKGHTGIYRLIKKAIESTDRFIYMEDQYLVCDMPMGQYKSMLSILIDKIKSPKFEKLIIFCTRIDDINNEFQQTGWKHRNNFISSLLAANSEKVEICQYKRKDDLNCPGNAWSGLFYIHSKTWIFDDNYLITGSANCNRRGYSHDSELNIGIYAYNDFIKDLRVKLWLKRLNIKGIPKLILYQELLIFKTASKYWADPDLYSLPIENSKKHPFEPKEFKDLNVEEYLKQLENSNNLFTNKPLQTFLKTKYNSTKMNFFWDNVVDPEGT